MSVAKVTVNGTTIVDLTDATAGASTIIDGNTAYIHDGSKVTGVVVPQREACWDDVCFWDYDGTIKYSYSASEFASLTEMPQNPEHAGLISEGWNWTLADAKAHVQTYGCLDIGQLYITDDDKTRLYINVTDILRPRVTLRLIVYTANKLHLDWGDGSPEETNATASATSYIHDYAAKGKYVITLWTEDDVLLQLGSDQNSYNQSLFGNSDGGITRPSVAKLYKVECGANVRLANPCFSEHAHLTYLTMSSGTNIYNADGSTFTQTSLKALILPKQFAKSSGQKNLFTDNDLQVVCLAKQDFVYCYNGQPGKSIRRLCIPVITTVNNVFTNARQLETVFIYDDESNTSIGVNSFWNCYSLVKITIPSHIASIPNNTLTNVYSLKEVHMRPTTPPTLGGTTFCSGRPSDCIIYVPYSADHSVLTAYQTATNWSSLSSYMQEEPQS